MKRIVVGVSGASGFPLAKRLLWELKLQKEIETHLVCSKGAAIAAEYEMPGGMERLVELADVCYCCSDMGAPIASGTFSTDGMIILPCSMKTLAGIACGYSDNLLLRAADVTIKEQRTLVLAVRESPLSAIHLRNMESLSRIPGVFLMPPVISYYSGEMTLEDLERQIAGKLLLRFGIEVPGYIPWGRKKETD